MSDIDKGGFLALKEARKCLADLYLNLDVQTLMQLCGEDTGLWRESVREIEREWREFVVFIATQNLVWSHLKGYRVRERERERERER